MTLDARRKQFCIEYLRTLRLTSLFGPNAQRTGERRPLSGLWPEGNDLRCVPRCAFHPAYCHSVHSKRSAAASTTRNFPPHSPQRDAGHDPLSTVPM
jgi:hypothetical protein